MSLEPSPKLAIPLLSINALQIHSFMAREHQEGARVPWSERALLPWSNEGER